MESLRMNPHRMRRIGQPSPQKRISRQQIAEVILEMGAGSGKTGNSAVRKARARRPQMRMLVLRLRPSAPRVRSALANHLEPSWGG